MSDINENVVNEQQKEPVITNVQSHSLNSLEFVIMPVGQGGASIGECFVANLPNNPFMIAVNTSDQDLDRLNIPDNQKFKIGGSNIQGAGKNRDRAKQYYKQFAAINVSDNNTKMSVIETIIGYYEEVLFHPTKQKIIIIPFSSDGGSGSGIGPMLVAALSNYVNAVDSFTYGNKEYKIDDVTNAVPRPVVVGVTSKCAIVEGSGNIQGAGNLQNTISCFLDIQKAIDNRIGHFFIADNSLPKGIKYNSTAEMYKIINARIVAPFIKFLGIETNGSIKCMDLQDKINSLRIYGCSSFTTLTEPNQYQYIIPNGQSITRTVLMLNSEKDLGTEERLAKHFLIEHDITSIDYTSVFFEVEKTGITDSISKEMIGESMMMFFGFRSLNAIVEDLRETLKRITVSNDKKHSNVKSNSTGFSTIEEDAEDLNNRFKSNVIDPSKLNDLF